MEYNEILTAIAAEIAPLRGVGRQADYIPALAKVNPDLFIINYDMGDSRPLTDNDTRDHRALNRRIEFFLVPGPKLITLAHTKKIK